MAVEEAALALHPDRLLPVDPGTREIARRIYAAVRDLPVISPHGHVPPRVLLDDEPFPDPATLFVTPDHYVTRLLHASGVGLDALGVGDGPLSEDRSREVWRLLCSRWDVFRGTPMRFWLEVALAELFDVALRPSAASADAIYDHLADRLTLAAYRPRALFERFRIEVLATPTIRATTWRRTPRWPPTRRSRVVCCRRSGRTATSSPRSPAGPRPSRASARWRTPTRPGTTAT